MKDEILDKPKESIPMVQSKTIWGNLICLLALAGQGAELMGVIPPGAINTVLTIVTGAIGNVISIWGRVIATKKITGVFNP